MRTALDPFSFLVTCVARSMNSHQPYVIEYLIEENRVLREQIGCRRLRFNDDQRRRLAVKAKELGRKLLAQVATIVTSETLMAPSFESLILLESLILGPELDGFEGVVNPKKELLNGLRCKMDPSPSFANFNPLNADRVLASHREPAPESLVDLENAVMMLQHVSGFAAGVDGARNG